MSPRQRLLSIVLLAVFLAIAGGVLPAAADELYVVQPGDTLYRIALRFNTTVSALMQANNLTNSNWITVGQQLLVPGPGEAVSPTTPPTTEPGMGSYVVKSGDTLSAIARQTGVSVTAIAQANGIINPSLIYVGQELVIPGSTATPAPVASPEPAAAPESGGGFLYGAA